MAHSFIQSFDSETAAFEAFARARPANIVLLIDTYDTEAAAAKVVALVPRLKALGIAIHAVRIDSGDLIALSKSVRRILDAGGLQETGIFASGGIDEDRLGLFANEKAPIDGIGIGTSLATSSDAPALDCAYKLQEYAGLPRRKRSTGKATWPGRKQIWRRYDRNDRMMADVLSTEQDNQDGEPLIQPVMANGKRIASQLSLHELRAHGRRELERLPRELTTTKSQVSYPVQVAAALEQLAAVTDARLSHWSANNPVLWPYAATKSSPNSMSQSCAHLSYGSAQ
jgi:nicotinate phosphoribosyltransferase